MSWTQHPDARRLQDLGITPRLKQDAGSEQYCNVVFCAPPSGCEDYVAEVRLLAAGVTFSVHLVLLLPLARPRKLQSRLPDTDAGVRRADTIHYIQVHSALQLWDGTGSFVFTSSAGIYGIDDGSSCTEDSPVHALGHSDRTDRHGPAANLQFLHMSQHAYFLWPHVHYKWLTMQCSVTHAGIVSCTQGRMQYGSTDSNMYAMRTPTCMLQLCLTAKPCTNPAICCTSRLLLAEQAVLEANGCVVRLAGLYHAQRYLFLLRCCPLTCSVCFILPAGTGSMACSSHSRRGTLFNCRQMSRARRTTMPRGRV